MYLQIDLLHVGSGPFFHASGRKRPDCYRFMRVKGQEHIHRLIVQGDTAEKMEDTLKDLGLRLQQADIPVQIKVVIEDKDREGADVIAGLNERKAALETTVAELQTKLDKRVPSAKTEAGGTKRLSDEQVTMLAERDDMLLELADFVEGEETPLEVLKRVLAHYKVLTEASSQVDPQAARRDELSKLGKKALRRKIGTLKLKVETDANISTMVEAILKAEAKKK